MVREEILISHLQSADDTVLFLRDSADQIRWLRGILRCSEATSGFVVNLHKSMVFLIGNVGDLESLLVSLV